MKRAVTSVTLAVGLAFASLAGAATASASSARPVAVVQLTAFNRAEHPDIVQTEQIAQMPSFAKKTPRSLERPGAFGWIPKKHIRFNLFKRPRIIAARIAREARLAAAAKTPSVTPSSLGSVASGPWPGGAFGACVVARESGGNPQIMNSTGHYGLYQFSESTWITYGGSASTFGHATVAEQEAVFMNALAAGGESNWAPYDGC